MIIRANINRNANWERPKFPFKYHPVKGIPSKELKPSATAPERDKVSSERDGGYSGTHRCNGKSIVFWLLHARACHAQYHGDEQKVAERNILLFIIGIIYLYKETY
jgi:hypothetical protein